MLTLCLIELDINRLNGVRRKSWITATVRTSLIILLAAHLPLHPVLLIAVPYAIPSARPPVRRLARLLVNRSVLHPADRVCLASQLAGRRATLPAGHGLNASPTALQAAGQLFIKIGTVPL
jgi:hypothetical protein